jgi:hypothetical protein
MTGLIISYGKGVSSFQIAGDLVVSIYGRANNQYRQACNWRFARQDAKERGERDDAEGRSDDSYSPRRHWRFKSPTRSVGPGFAYRRVMTLVSFDDDLEWEFAFDSRLGHE